MKYANIYGRIMYLQDFGPYFCPVELVCNGSYPLYAFLPLSRLYIITKGRDNANITIEAQFKQSNVENKSPHRTIKIHIPEHFWSNPHNRNIPKVF